ncbi:MAG: TIGR01459 family HAD-type hydrolase [Hyphomonadaceae bacterium]
MTKAIDSLDDITGRYDAFLCDMWGVVHNGRRYFPAAAAALERARQAGKIVLLVSNVPKPRDPIPSQLERLRLPRGAWDAIVTSGDAIRAELAKRAPGPMLKIGPAGDAVLWEGLGLRFADVRQARFVGVSGLNYDGRDDSPENYADVLAEAKARDLELLCANPDIIVRWGDELIWCAGALARDYAALGGRVVMAGKPHPPIYELAYRELESIAGRPIEKARILAIGDGVATDIKGANDQRLDSLFIASGMHGEALWTDGALDAAKVDLALTEEGVAATYAMAELR